MLVSEFLKKYVFGRLNKHGLTSKISSVGMLWLIEWGLTKIYNLTQIDKTKFHNWEIQAEAFPFTWCYIRLQTKLPIREIKWFYSWDLPANLEFNDSCDTCWCKQIESGICTECNTSCSFKVQPSEWDKVTRLNLTEKTPWAQLSKWEYQIVSGRNNPWYWWQVILVYLPECVSTQGIWVEYHAWYNPITCYEDDINLPHPLYPVLADFIISDALDVYWQSKEWIAANAYQKAKESLFWFNEADSRAYDIKSVETSASEKQKKTWWLNTSAPFNNRWVNF